MTGPAKPPKRPCGSCPYRCDVPSGVWSAEEYAKLPGYDGDIADQLEAGALGVFMCHQRDGCICGGWLATHGAGNLLAVALAASQGHVDRSAFTYQTDVPVFPTGAAAAAHGLRDIDWPRAKARRLIRKILPLIEGSEK